ncbi:hypothetical protein C5C94_07105 [Rathayibacter sp. AY1C3]|nr:hypothetical protein C5B92_13960 [Rathayibacter sp. AY1A4]PPG81546.1 hypothetical protein C5C52_09080 [Rathayibacter sp. AY1E5]PPH32198.1 hypothetical protein C5C94_07105 [Rathayibacter sp. AY1C3]PPH66304.1 hypothetical protein C5D25_01475 [Rathayibacter sp. AY1D7]PPI31276.1 hypothetical protein C5D66_07900 [Rathayibacter sp. AY1B4]
MSHSTPSATTLEQWARVERRDSELSALHFDPLSFATVRELSHSTLSATTLEQWADDRAERLSSELCALSFGLRCSLLRESPGVVAVDAECDDF